MPAESDGLLLLTGNAASGRGARGQDPDIGSWAEAASALAPDVLAVQEVDHRLSRSGGVDQAARVATASGLDTWRFAAAVLGTPGDRATFGPAGPAGSGPPIDVGDQPSYGVALLSRHPVLRWWEHRMGPSRAQLPVPTGATGGPRVTWVPDEPRVAVAARVAHPGGDLTAVCTHLSFNPVRAAAQLRELVRWAEELPRPLVLLGDLNLPGRAPARVTGWRPAVTAPTFPSLRPTVQLDHALVDDPDGAWSGVAGGAVAVAGSDHLALTVALRR